MFTLHVSHLRKQDVVFFLLRLMASHGPAAPALGLLPAF